MGFDMNSGYSGWSMSVNAARAYRGGEKPASKWTKAEMLEALRDAAEELEIQLPDTLGKLRKDALFSRLFSCSSWHHTSIMCNETDFYYVDYDAIESLTPELVERWLAEDAAAKGEGSGDPAEAKPEYARVSFTEWVGTGNYKRAVDQDGWGELRGGWCHLIEPSANGCQKKSVAGGKCNIAARFASEREMLDDRALSVLRQFDGECISAKLNGVEVKGFVKAGRNAKTGWLCVVSADGSVSKKRACAGNKLEQVRKLLIGNLRKEKSLQSKAMLAMRDEHEAGKKRC